MIYGRIIQHSVCIQMKCKIQSGNENVMSNNNNNKCLKRKSFARTIYGSLSVCWIVGAFKFTLIFTSLNWQRAKI